MDKNLIMLLGILALWVLVIRPTNRKKVTTHESSSGQTHGGGGSSFEIAAAGRSSTL